MIFKLCNTDIQKTFNLLLDTYKKHGTAPEDVVKNVMIISDMEFDQATQGRYFDGDKWHNRTLTTMETVQDQWKDAGYELPRLIFWNVNASRVLDPILDNEHGIIMLSGFSTNNLDMVLSGEFEKEVEKQVEVMNQETGEMETKTVSEKVTMTPAEQLEARISKERYDDVEQAVNIGISKDVGLDSRPIKINMNHINYSYQYEEPGFSDPEYESDYRNYDDHEDYYSDYSSDDENKYSDSDYSDLDDDFDL